MANDTAGFYHDPPLWVGEKPTALASPSDLGSLRDTMFRRKLSSGIDVKVTKEGLFGFSFADWKPGIRPLLRTDGSVSFDDTVEAVLNQTLVMNSFLAFLYTNELLTSGFARDRMVVTPELVVAFSEGLDGQGMSYASQRVTHLAGTSSIGTYNPILPIRSDDRIRTRFHPIEIDTLRRSADDLERLMTHRHTDGLLVVDLFLRAGKSFQDHHYSAALIGYWAVSEKLIQELWQTYQGDNRTRDGRSFISGARKKTLEDGRSFTMSVITEILSFTDRITLELYEGITKVRKARNNWIHSLKSITRAEAVLASEVCESLLNDARRVTLKAPISSRI